MNTNDLGKCPKCLNNNLYSMLYIKNIKKIICNTCNNEWIEEDIDERYNIVNKIQIKKRILKRKAEYI